jgi:hypothetical protein
MIKRLNRIFLLICLVCLTRTGNAQTGAVTPPVLTYIVDSAHHLRPLIGVVGAASVSNPVDVGLDVMQAAVPPAHDYLLATSPGASWPVLFQIHGGAMTPQAGAFGNNPNHIDRVALSPSGFSAAFLSVSQDRIYIFKNLSQNAFSGGSVNVSSLGPVSAFCISDDGNMVVIGVSDGQTGSLWVAKPGTPPVWITSMSHPSAITFLRYTTTALIADDMRNTVYWLSDGQIFPIASAQDGISMPNGVAVSNDNVRIFVSNWLSGSVVTIVPGGTNTPPLYCNCTISGLYPTNTDSVFRLTDFSGGSVLLFDANRATPRIAFVPVSGSQF